MNTNADKNPTFREIVHVPSHLRELDEMSWDHEEGSWIGKAEELAGPHEDYITMALLQTIHEMANRITYLRASLKQAKDSEGHAWSLAERIHERMVEAEERATEVRSAQDEEFGRWSSWAERYDDYEPDTSIETDFGPY